MFSRSLFSSYVYRSCRCSMPVYMYACMCHDVRCRFDVCAARRWMPCEGSDESSIGNQNADPRLCIQQRSAAISHTINPVLTTYSRSHRCFYDHQLPIRDVKLFIHDSTLPIRRSCWDSWHQGISAGRTCPRLKRWCVVIFCSVY
jgi:hypothetical protein